MHYLISIYLTIHLYMFRSGLLRDIHQLLYIQSSTF